MELIETPKGWETLSRLLPVIITTALIFWRPQQLRDPNDGEPSNPANWPRLVITN